MRSRVTPILVMVLGLVAVTGCGSSAPRPSSQPTPTVPSHTGIAVNPCAGGSNGLPLIRLSNKAPQPRLTINAGQTFKVVAKYGATKVQLPRATQHSGDVQIVSMSRCSHGATAGLFKATHPGRVFFFSSYLVATEAMDPSLGGYVTIHDTHGG